jgi:hypothetical protein
MFAHWSLDDGGGAVVVESINGANGMVVGAPVWTDGPRRGALLFDGDGARVEVADGPQWDLAGKSFSVSAWALVSATAPAADRQIINHLAGGSPGAGWTLGTDGNTVPNTVTFSNRATNNVCRVRTKQPMNDGAWHHYVATLEAGMFACNLYLDGALEATDTFDGLIDQDETLTFGSDSDGTGAFVGGLDDVRFYPRALDGPEALVLFSGCVDGA